ncbi:ADP-ribosylglycohydrolase [Rhizoctonia solani 123E]|uniref:mRNA 3'-end-processing protein n=1 Tax=Rhizoctonia solani 123E TaxID=1423351 RepID=A0A074SUW6_9AGAM|nr:ADP-ribosylglycohydrolase [Rhizoctonia solani 123E]
MAAQTSDPLAQTPALADVVHPDFHQVNSTVELYIKNQLGLKLDTDEQICRLALTPAGCPLGPRHCPLRHTTPSPLNFGPQDGASGNTGRDRLATVCKHWLRGLCKKGDGCEFLHEYNLRRMPECWWFARHGTCTAGDECLYAHPKERKIECPDYQRGFCKLGPDCPRKHVRRVACQLYLSGFCPDGPECKRGHPKPGIPPPEAYRPPSPPQRDLGPPPPGWGRFNEHGAGPNGSGGGFVVGQNNPGFAPRRNLDEVLCFKLCLAMSLSSTEGRLDWVDAARRWASWRRHGYMSVIGTCFDIGGTTQLALLSYSKLLDPKNPRPIHTPNMNPEIECSGNGSLMRLSPVPAALHRDPPLAMKTASLQSKITHASPLCVDSCILATAYMIGFYHAEANTAKERKQVVLSPDFTPFSDGTPIPLESAELRDLHKRQLYKEKNVVNIETSGYVLATLEAALWALWHSDTFEEGLLLLLPLGDDVDTIGAVYGELAGACYGYDEIPGRWLDALQRQDMLQDAYAGIIELGLKP